MTELNARSLEDAMVSCYDGFNRKLCIAFTTHKRMYDFAMALQRQQREGLVPATQYRRGVDEIFFDTGSSIKMVDVSDVRNLYGHTFHRVLYDPDIKDPVVLEHLRSCERLLWKNNRQPYVEMEIDTQPLDDFLGGFTVIKP